MSEIITLEAMTWDLIVIGGGINGAGVARDAALRGLKTLLLDRGDFCGGATSWSTRLVHGGLRYLEYFEVNLVRESLREREILLRTAPHLVKPLLLTIPIYRDRSRPYWKVQAGMALYDLLSYDKSLPNHRMLSAATFMQLFRNIIATALAGAAQYYDAQVSYAERLALENVLDAEMLGATVRNYVEVTGLGREGDRITQLECRDRLTGESLMIHCHPSTLIINTAGPWVDQVLQSGHYQERPAPIGDRPKIGPTKGSHIVVDRFPGMPLDSAIYVEARSDGRPFFIVPWLGQVLIGTTDLHYQGDLDQIKASDDEIDYLIQETNAIIPTAQLNRSSIKATYSGVRPLPHSNGKKTSSITRSHILYHHDQEGASNLISLIGGKITTYRQVGEEAVNAAVELRKKSIPVSRTASRPLPGAILPNDQRIQHAIAAYRDRLDLSTIDYLFELYGARAIALLELIDEFPELADSLQKGHPSVAAQIVFAARSEYAQTIIDILHRRTLLSIQFNYGLDLLPIVGDLLRCYCDWSEARIESATLEYQEFMRTHCIPDFTLNQTQSNPRLLKK
jgi:glycerol-3-phosphate dehydrogenase